MVVQIIRYIIILYRKFDEKNVFKVENYLIHILENLMFICHTSKILLHDS